MLDFTHTNPVSLAFAAGGWLALALLTYQGTKASRPAGKGKRDFRSLLGVIVQGLGIAVTLAGKMSFATQMFGAPEMISAAIVGGITVLSLLLFWSARRTLAENWTIVATVAVKAAAW